MKHYDVICIGEILVDIISQEAGKSLVETAKFTRFPGGAPANVAVGLARLGQKVGFAGRVGEDFFGRFLLKHLRGENVITDCLIKDNEHQTRLAFVEVGADAERSFEFYGKSPADLAFVADDLSKSVLKKTKLLHFGSLALTDEHSRQEFDRIIGRRGSDTLISFDPNYRASLWKSEAEAFKILNSFAVKAHILKMDLDEAMLLCNCNSLADVLKSLSFETTQIVAITLGSDGCVLKSATHKCRIPGFSVKAVDTTGCGDAFMAALIDGILSTGKQPRTLSKDELYKIGCRANAAGAFTAMHYGAMSGLPTVAKLNEYIQSNMET